jgi:hypothetical protein
MKMQATILWFALCSLLLAGCKTATRLSIKPEEANSHFVIQNTHETPKAAFNAVEFALAEIYNDLPRVLKLKQAQTGTFLLKPVISYQVGGAFGPVHHAGYTLKIVVGDSISLNFELGPEVTQGTWAPESEIPKIKAEFRSIAARVAKAVNGSLE